MRVEGVVETKSVYTPYAMCVRAIHQKLGEDMVVMWKGQYLPPKHEKGTASRTTSQCGTIVTINDDGHEVFEGFVFLYRDVS